MAKKTEDDTDPYGHPRIPYRGHYDRDRCDLRRGWVERFASCSLKLVGQWWDGEGEDDSRSCLRLKGNIENPIGLVKVPLAVAGPLLVRGKHASGYVLAPCATTEGTLVASVTRGAAALTRAGGVWTLASEKYMIRAPSFTTRNAEESEQLWQWLRSHKDDLQKQIRLYSRHATLVELSPFRQGRTLIVRFMYTTGDASGQNMVTTATWNSCKWALEQITKDLPNICIQRFMVESLFSGDKQTSSSLLVLPRGVHVQAEVWIPESVLVSTLKIDLQTLLTGYHDLLDGKTHLGTLGTTVNIGNLLAAVFIATGQDVASLPECANGLLIIRPANRQEIDSCGMSKETPSSGSIGDVYAGVYACLVLPGLVIGTVGGGTQLATQRECLSMMGCYGKDGVYRLAEIIAGFSLGLDLSLVASVISGQFATAHEKLGRNRPTSGMKEEYLVKELFQEVIGDRGVVNTWRVFDVNTGNSILSDLTKRELSKKVGHFGFHITFQAKDGISQTLPVVMKSKPSDSEVCNMVNKLAQGCGLKLAVLYEKYKMETDFRLCSQREVELCRLENSVLKQFMPVIYHTLLDNSKELYVIMMEYLTSENVYLLDTVDDVSVWTTNDIKVVLRDLAHMHSVYLSQSDWLSSQPWLERVTVQQMTEMAPLWKELMMHAHREFPHFWTTQRVSLVNEAIDRTPHILTIIESAPHTLIHNDCNPRNICLRLSPSLQPHLNSFQNVIPAQQCYSEDATASGPIPFQDARTLCMYDWELATVGVPQYDIAEFLCFTLLPSTPNEVWQTLLEFYRQHLEYYSGVNFPSKTFLGVFHCCLLHFAMKRLALYTMAHTHKDYRYLPRVVDTLFSFVMGQHFSPSLLAARL